MWPILIMAAVFFASGQSDIAAPDVGISLDKIAHFAVFGALATSIVRIHVFADRGVKGAVFAWLLVAGFGAMDEWRQSFTPGRSVEFADWVADALGAATAVGMYRGCRAYRNFLEFRIPWPSAGLFRRKKTEEGGAGAGTR